MQRITRNDLQKLVSRINQIENRPQVDGHYESIRDGQNKWVAHPGHLKLDHYQDQTRAWRLVEITERGGESPVAETQINRVGRMTSREMLCFLTGYLHVAERNHAKTEGKGV